MMIADFRFYASAQRNVAGGILFLSCSSVRPCVRLRTETLLTRYLAEYLTHFHQTYINDTMRYGTEMNASQFGVKRSKVEVTLE